MEEKDHGDRKEKEDAAMAAAIKPTRSFRYEDYSTRRVFLRSYPLQWDWAATPDDKQRQHQGLGGAAAPDVSMDMGYSSSGDSHDGDREDGRRGGGRGGWKRQVVVAVVEWGEEKMLLLRRAKKQLALYLLGCHHGRPALGFKSGGSSTAAMLTSRSR